MLSSNESQQLGGRPSSSSVDRSCGFMSVTDPLVDEDTDDRRNHLHHHEINTERPKESSILLPAAQDLMMWKISSCNVETLTMEPRLFG